MDPRVNEQARILVEHSTGVEPGDDVLVIAPPVAEDLLVAVFEVLGEHGASPKAGLASSRARRAYMRAADEGDFRTPEHALAEMEATDVVIQLMGSRNATETSDVAPTTTAARSRAHRPVQEAFMETTWVLTQHPAPGDAQVAEMSTEGYADFVYGAVNKDWAAQREFQQPMADLLDDADRVRVVSGDTTDVRMAVDGMAGANDFGERNMPGGEAYTVPVPETVEGEVLFDLPVRRQGREILGARLTFEDGEVVDHAAEKNEALLGEILATDDGARRLGELGIGMNRDIDRFTNNMLFDEKMGDTVHLALGDAIDWCVPDDRSANESATHVDMIVDMSDDSYIEVDGEVVQRDGRFRFEVDDEEWAG